MPEPGPLIPDVVWNVLQWTAMATTLIAAWLVASTAPGRRAIGFWCFLASNALWIAWGIHDGAFALVALQVGLAGLNIRGGRKNEAVATGSAQAQ